MAKRWLKATLSRTLEADVYLCVDEDRVPLSHLPPWSGGPNDLRVTAQIALLAERAARADCVPDSAWSERVVLTAAQVISEDEAQGNALGVLVYDVSEWPAQFLPSPVAVDDDDESAPDVSVGLPQNLRTIGRGVEAILIGVLWLALAVFAGAWAWAILR